MTSATAIDPTVVAPAAPPVPTPYHAWGHRGPYVGMRKAEGTYRIVLVGDSMTYGHGLPHRKTLSQRLAAFLNGGLADRHVKGISLGVPGACLFHALDRAEDQALARQPDVLIVAACCNDAYMLRPQPSTNEAIGQAWVDFQPHIAFAQKAFADRVRAAGVSRVAALGYPGFSVVLARRRP